MTDKVVLPSELRKVCSYGKVGESWLLGFRNPKEMVSVISLWYNLLTPWKSSDITWHLPSSALPTPVLWSLLVYQCFPDSYLAPREEWPELSCTFGQISHYHRQEFSHFQSWNQICRKDVFGQGALWFILGLVNSWWYPLGGTSPGGKVRVCVAWTLTDIGSRDPRAG